jgi:16S rRNA (cytidine1402-2'-O)-methyltransferase
MEKLLIIPMPLGKKESHPEISPEIVEALRSCDLIFAERARTLRRFIGPIDPNIRIPELNIEELPKKPDARKKKEVLQKTNAYTTVGLVSEAGSPGIADPGYYLVRYAHQHESQVIPLSGPSSIYLALMASGMNGQQFCFHGYLPRQEGPCTRAILRMERDLRNTGYTQLFMETPYRNNQLMERLLKNLRPETLLHISCELTTDNAMSRTRNIEGWSRQNTLNLHKKPCIFAIGK